MCENVQKRRNSLRHISLISMQLMLPTGIHLSGDHCICFLFLMTSFSITILMPFLLKGNAVLHLSTLPIILYESRNEELTREIMTKTFSNPDTTSLRQLPTAVHWLVHVANRNEIGRALREPLTRCPATSFFNYCSQLLLEFVGESFLAKQGGNLLRSPLWKSCPISLGHFVW